MHLRTCIGCRRTADAGELIRIVVDAARPGVIRVDPRRRLPGRGAHLHPTTPCFEAATRKRAFARALRAAPPLQTDDLESYILRVRLDQPDRDPIGEGSR